MCLLQNFANTVQFCASTTRLKKILTSNDQVLYAFLDITGAFTQRCFFSNFNTDVCTLHTGAFTQRCFTRKYLYAKVLVHRDAFTNRNFYTQTHRYFYTLHTDVFAQRCFYAGMLLHTRTFTQGFFWHRVALTLMKRLHKSAYTEMFLHNRNTFIQRRFLHTDTYTTVHRDAFTHRCLYTLIRLLTAFTYDIQVLLRRYSLHANTFTQRYFDTQWQVLLHAGDVFFTHSHYIVFHTHMLFHRDVTEMLLHRVAFTHRNAFTHTQSLLHRDDFTLSNFTHRCQNKQVFFLQRNGFTQGAFAYGRFYTDIR